MSTNSRFKKDKIPSFLKAYSRVKLLKQRIPFMVSWEITRRCNSKCLYCIGNVEEPELSTKQVLEVIRKMAVAGTKIISLTGGEPLMRSDIGQVIDFAARKNIFIKLATNGFLLKERIKELTNASIIQLSLDGDREITENIRGRETFGKTIQGLQAAIKYRVPIYLNTVVSKFNHSSLHEVLDICDKYKVKTFFQPARLEVLRDSRKNPVCLSPEEHKTSIKKLIQYKKSKKFAKTILNSFSGLSYLYEWPKPSPLAWCSAAKLTFRLNNQGRLCACPAENVTYADVLQSGFSGAVEKVETFKCDGCWCASQLEFNLVMNFKLEAIKNFFMCKFL